MHIFENKYGLKTNMVAINLLRVVKHRLKINKMQIKNRVFDYGVWAPIKGHDTTH
jgi:hypothetical protein